MKYCAYCGSSMEDTNAFCPNCGAAANKPEANEPAVDSTDTANTATEAESPARHTATYVDYTPEDNTEDQEKAVKVALTLAILGAVGAALGFFILFAIAGIILSAIAVAKVNKARDMGASGGKLTAANAISKIGLVMSIIRFVYCVVLLFAAG